MDLLKLMGGVPACIAMPAILLLASALLYPAFLLSRRFLDVIHPLWLRRSLALVVASTSWAFVVGATLHGSLALESGLPWNAFYALDRLVLA